MSGLDIEFKHSDTLGIQSIIYNSKYSSVRKTILSLKESVKVLLDKKLVSQVNLLWGDCSPEPCFSDSELADARAISDTYFKISYKFFNKNAGSALGHNILFSENRSEFILILNPDVIVSPQTLSVMIHSYGAERAGIVEARQIPVEHPKSFDETTGETSWASTCCALTRRELYEAIAGFDHASFFLYCDDVDFSWMIRKMGYKILYQPAAVVYHDKKLSVNGKWISSAAERYYSAEAALILAHKWSRPDIVQAALKFFDEKGDEPMKNAALEYRRRLIEGRLPDSLDQANQIGQFVSGNYAEHRFTL